MQDFIARLLSVLANFAMIITIVWVSAAYASDIVFGRLDADGQITNLMYYQNGDWKDAIWGSMAAPATKDTGLSPNQSKRMRAWEQTSQGRDHVEMSDYAKIFWESDPATFSHWYLINISSQSVLIPSLRAVPLDGGAGDCAGDEWGIQTDHRGSASWVASRKSGYAWRAFLPAAFVLGYPVNDSRQSLQKDIPASYGPLVENIKKRWADLESSIIKGLVSAEHRDKVEADSRKSLFVTFSIQSAIWPRNNISLVFFHATKYINSTAPIPEGLSGEFEYRGWAVVWPDGRIEWPRAVVEPQDQEHEEIYPIALLELENRRYLIAKADLVLEKGVIVRSGIFELVNGWFKSKGRYPRSCD